MKKRLPSQLFFLLFPISAFSQSPGGLGTANLRLWLKSNTGVTVTGSNTVSQWADQSGNSANASQATTTLQPGFTANSQRFNGYPSLDFDLTDDNMPTLAVINTTPYTVFVVYNNTNPRVLLRRAVSGSNNWLLGPSSNLARFFAGTWVDNATATFTGNTPVISTGQASAAATANANSYYNGRLINPSPVTATTAPGTIYLGSLPAFNQPMGGSMSEVIAYNTALSVTDRLRVESYLALKYGLSLNQTTPANYVNSSGAVIYNSATGGTHQAYANDVAGILVDNGSGLSQSSSGSMNTAAMLSSISNPSTPLSNGEYIIMGDNGAAAAGRNSTDVPVAGTRRLTRIWRVAKSAAAAQVTLKLYIGDIPELVMPGRNLTNVGILRSTTTTFAGATTFAASSMAGVFNDTLVIPNVVLNNNDYFTLSLGANTPPATGDFELWFGVPQWSVSFFSPQKLHLTAGTSGYAYYTIDQPADPSFAPITGVIAPSEAEIIDFSGFVTNNVATDKIMVMPANTVVNRGLRISVKGEMSAYYANENTNNYASFPLRSFNALGTSFYIPGQALYNNGSSWLEPQTSEFIVTATENNTAVTIIPSEAIVGREANLPFTITLNRGQSYQAQNLAKTGKHLAGSLVTSTKPVVVTYSDDLLAIGSAADNTGDQLVPISRYGNDYVHIRTSLTNMEPLLFIGSQDNTTVTINDGTTVRTRVIHAGTLDSVTLLSGKDAQYIHADKPILAYQIGGSGTELGSGILAPVVACKGINILAFQFPTLATQANFNFVVPPGIEGSFVVNGSNAIITAADFSPVPGTSGWLYCRKDVTAYFVPGQTVTIRNTGGRFFFYQNTKTPTGGDFSNFTDFGNVALSPKAYQLSCAGTTIQLDGGAMPHNANIASYSWSGPNGFTSTTANPSLSNPSPADSGWYVITALDNNNCVYKDSTLVSVPISTVTASTAPLPACAGSNVRLNSLANAGVLIDSLRWTGPNGFTSTQPSFSILNAPLSAAGTYQVTYYDRNGCIGTASTTLAITNSTIANVAISGSAQKINCSSAPSVTLNAAGYVNGLNYQTYNPYKAGTLYASGNFKTVAPGFYNITPTTSGTLTGSAAVMNLSNLAGITGTTTNAGVQYDGFIFLAQPGTYTFFTQSKDGSNLFIDGMEVVSNDGIHAAAERSGSVSLTAGYHAINVNYYNGPSGNGALEVSYACAACATPVTKTVIPPSALFVAGGSAPSPMNYAWSNGATGSTVTVTQPGTYTLTATNGSTGCTTSTEYVVTGSANYDYGDLPSTWPSAQAAVLNCTNASGVPAGGAAAVWAGLGVSYEATVFSDAQPTIAAVDSYDDGLGAPTTTLTTGNNMFYVNLNSNVSGKTVYYGLWFDWNNNGNFADDQAANGGVAFYSGSGVTTTSVTVPVTVGVPADRSADYKVRLMVSDAPVGFADFGNVMANGEVEDYRAPMVALPVRFDRISATSAGCLVRIAFETYEEITGSRYFIERSVDGTQWHTVISFNAGAGTLAATGSATYRFTDDKPLPGVSFYRLREVQPNGEHTLSRRMQVITNCNGMFLRAYPLPAHDKLYIELPVSYKGATISLFNSIGQRVLQLQSAQPSSVQVLNTAGLPAGIYLLQVAAKGHTVIHQQVQLQ